jgi:hypothetical protein
MATEPAVVAQINVVHDQSALDKLVEEYEKVSWRLVIRAAMYRAQQQGVHLRAYVLCTQRNSIEEP